METRSPGWRTAPNHCYPAAQTGPTVSTPSLVSPSKGSAVTIPDVNRLAPATALMSALNEAGALSDLDNVAVRIADVAANLVVLFLRLRDEHGSSTFP